MPRHRNNAAKSERYLGSELKDARLCSAAGVRRGGSGEAGDLTEARARRIPYYYQSFRIQATME
jgi:hypothetical protein